MGQNPDSFNTLLNDKLREIKHNFMVFRNGIISDTLRSSGMPYKIIFGLQLPQLSQIASGAIATLSEEKDEGQVLLLRYDLASRLWADRGIRESRLLAPYIFPPEMIEESLAFELARDVITKEEADILCFRLLRRLPFAESLARRLTDDDTLSPEARYCGQALFRNLEAMR